MKDAIHKLVLVVLVAFMSVSCATQKLWESTDYREWIFIPADKITETELQRRDVKYKKIPAESEVDRTTKYSFISFGGYLVEKSALQKLRDHTYRALGTPVTITIDAACVATVVGVIGAYIYYGGPYPHPATNTAAGR